MSTNHQGYTRFLLTTMANRTTLDNPYANSNTPAGLFYGREELLSWIRQKLIVYYRDQPLLLVGLAGMGKTTLLQQLLNSQPGDTHRFAYIPLPGMAQDSLDAFLWTLAEQITRSLQAQGLRLTLPTRRSFNASPQRAFANYFLEPVLAALKGQYLVLLADDADWLLQPAGDCPLAAEIRAYLYQLGQQQHRIQFLFARTGRESTLPTEALSPFRLPQIALVGPLSREASLAYIQEPVPYKVYADVADLLYTLTEGQPAALQQVCAGLFARWQRQELQQVTLADVVTVVRRQQMAGSGHPLRPPTQPYTAPADPPGATPAGARWRVWLLLLLVPLLLLAGAWLGATFRRPVNVAGPPAGAATATTTLTAAATAALAQVAGTPRATSPPPTRPATQAATMRPAGASPTPLPSTPSPTATPPASATRPVTPTPLPTEIIRAEDGMPMRLVPAGTFAMGTDSTRPEVGDDERPAHNVMLDAFYMDKYEVSVAQYATFLNTLPQFRESCPGLGCFLPRELIGTTSYLLEQTADDGRREYLALDGYANYPVNHVSWPGAVAYCQAMGARLPTEAEWEYAARGTDGRVYPWGNEPPDSSRAVFASSSYSDLQPVDALPAGASPFGILALAGSMWEWTADFYAADYYQDSPAQNPPGPDGGPGRVTRGGGWPNNNQADRIRSTNRNALEESFLSADLGFRCVRSVQP